MSQERLFDAAVELQQLIAACEPGDAVDVLRSLRDWFAANKSGPHGLDLYVAVMGGDDDLRDYAEDYVRNHADEIRDSLGARPLW